MCTLKPDFHERLKNRCKWKRNALTSLLKRVDTSVSSMEVELKGTEDFLFLPSLFSLLLSFRRLWRCENRTRLQRRSKECSSTLQLIAWIKRAVKTFHLRLHCIVVFCFHDGIASKSLILAFALPSLLCLCQARFDGQITNRRLLMRAHSIALAFLTSFLKTRLKAVKYESVTLLLIDLIRKHRGSRRL